MNDTSTKTDAVACFLDGQAYRARVARIHALMEQALMARERLDTSVRLRFRLNAGVETELRGLVALEQECCPFLAFALAQCPGEIVLTISGPERAAALLDEALGGRQHVRENTRTTARCLGGHGWSAHRRVRGRHLLRTAAGAGTIRSGYGDLTDHDRDMGRAV
jgi:hypothetical protein